ncbi:MAG: acetoacetate decarboxylase family protein [Deltaproteobacteria bacterium]|nr:acetoacetate decarboxylase family protein [Deltaproteobacteria bacterium]
MSRFFDDARDTTSVTHGSASFELPIRYYRDDCFMLFFSADADAVRATLPSDDLHPVTLFGGRATVAIVGYNYLDTSIGSYGEVAVAAAVVQGKRPLPLVPALLESDYAGFGGLVLHLPVTHRIARDAGRGQWGYTKFVADMAFENTPEHHSCRLSEKGEHILTLKVAKGGMFGRERRPITTYSVKEGDLIRTVIPQRGTFRWWPRCKKSSLELGSHPVAQSIQDLDLSPVPVLKRYFVERSAILPAGVVVERGVRPLEGYLGDHQEAEHTVAYTGGLG